MKQLAPAGLTDVTLMMCGSCGNENALKAAFIDYMVNYKLVTKTATTETILISLFLATHRIATETSHCHQILRSITLSCTIR